MADILSTPSPGAENDGHQWIQSEKTRCLGKSGKGMANWKTNCGYLSWGQVSQNYSLFSRENSLVTLRNQNKHCNLTEKIQLLEFQFSREKYSNILLDELIFAFLLQALMFSTTSMTGSGGFTPGTPVSTHFKRLSKKHREIHHKRYKKNRLEKYSKLNGKLFLKSENK